MDSLAQLIRHRRKELGLTLEALAATVGVTPGALSHIESGRRLPDPRNALAIAQALQIDPDEMFAHLDAAHSDRRASQVGRTGPRGPSASAPDGLPAPEAALYRAMPVEALFDGAPTIRLDHRMAPSSRERARFSASSPERLSALEELADDASRAIRTLRGMLDDEDPVVAREARRLLRELDVRGVEE